MKKRFIIALVVLLIFVFQINASGQKEGKVTKDNGSITVIFPQHEADKIGAFPARVKEFTEQTGIKVNLIQLGWDEVSG